MTQHYLSISVQR